MSIENLWRRVKAGGADTIAETIPSPENGMSGIWVGFRGFVHGEENGEPISALEYEAYTGIFQKITPMFIFSKK